MDYIIQFNFVFPFFAYAFSLFLNFKFLCLCGTVVALGRYQSASEPGSQNNESSNRRNEEEIIEQILKHDKSAAGIYCQLKTHHGPQVTHLPLLKDVIGIVALLGKVDDDNLSRLISHIIQYLLAFSTKKEESVPRFLLS